MRELFDGLELLLRVLPARSEYISHLSRVLSNCLRDSVNGAELRWDMAVLAIDLNNEEWLLQVCDFQIVVLGEVLGNTELVAVMSLKSHSHWSFSEIDILNEVGLLMTVGTNHGFKLELVKNLGLFVSDIIRVHDFMDSLKASFVRNELVDVVYNNGKTRGVVVG